MSCIMRDCAKWVFTFSILFYGKMMLLFTRYILAKELLVFFLERRPWFIIQPMLIARSNFTLEFGMSISMLNFFHDWKCKEKAICSCAFWYQDGEKQNKKWASYAKIQTLGRSVVLRKWKEYIANCFKLKNRSNVKITKTNILTGFDFTEGKGGGRRGGGGFKMIIEESKLLGKASQDSL